MEREEVGEGGGRGKRERERDEVRREAWWCIEQVAITNSQCCS